MVLGHGLGSWLARDDASSFSCGRAEDHKVLLALS